MDFIASLVEGFPGSGERIMGPGNKKETGEPYQLREGMARRQIKRAVPFIDDC